MLKAIIASIGLAASAFMAWLFRSWRKDVNYQKKVEAVNEQRESKKKSADKYFAD